jgi:hypothetical protein
MFYVRFCKNFRKRLLVSLCSSVSFVVFVRFPSRISVSTTMKLGVADLHQILSSLSYVGLVWFDVKGYVT